MKYIKNKDARHAEYKNLAEFMIDHHTQIKHDDQRNILKLAYLSLNPFLSFESFIDDPAHDILKKLSTYTCPYTGYKHYAFVPVAILSNDIEKFLEKDVQYNDMVIDRKWNHKDIDSYDESYRSKVIDILLGPGLRYKGMSQKGSVYTGIVGINCDNGDTVVFACLMFAPK